MINQLKTLANSTTGLKFTESPRWHNGNLWFADIHDKRIKTVDLAGSVATPFKLSVVSDSIVNSPDGRTLIVGVTLGHRLTAFDIQPEGSLGNRRICAQLPETVGTDGICADAV